MKIGTLKRSITTFSCTKVPSKSFFNIREHMWLQRLYNQVTIRETYNSWSSDIEPRLLIYQRHHPIILLHIMYLFILCFDMAFENGISKSSKESIIILILYYDIIINNTYFIRDGDINISYITTDCSE